MTDYNATVGESIQESIQSRSRVDNGGGGAFLINWLARGAGLIPPWWSFARDKSLREFWRKSDHLSGAIYALESKMTAIPFRVVPRDQSNRTDMIEADRITEMLRATAEFGTGWPLFYGRFVEDLLTQDNGAFAEVIGLGPKDGPIVGAPLSVANLDSAYCQRTGNPTYPVVYNDPNGGTYRLHFSRVIFMSQMTSPRADMNGVGFCGVSRCVNVAQTLIDLLTFKQEKMGSRPHRALMITRGMLDPSDIDTGFKMAEASMDNMGLSRYSKLVVVGNQTTPDADVKMVDLAGLPDGFNEDTSLTLGMATIALALGVDARELFPAMGAGATRADAMLQHLKQRGKGPGQILEFTENAFNMKFLPPYLRMEFDFQDDAQDRQAAEIQAIRSNARFRDQQTGVVDERTLRERMMRDGELDRTQFERLELDDGRLPDGTAITALFYSRDRKYKKYLDLGVQDPLDVSNNDAEMMLQLIYEATSTVLTELVNGADEDTHWALLQCRKALDELNKLYAPPPFMDTSLSQPGLPPGQTPGTPGSKPGSTSNRFDKNDYRVRRTDTATPKDSGATDPSERDHQSNTAVEAATN